MLTKYVLTIGGVGYDVPEECLKNWDEIAFTLKRTDYSGVMRSFSTEFVFCGETAEQLYDLYLADGFHASASVAVHTLTNRHEWVKQYEAQLDFSTLEAEGGTLSINAIDNTLGALIKAKKSTKYEFPVSSFATTRVTVDRMEIKNYARFVMVSEEMSAGPVDMNREDSGSQVLSTEYFEMYEREYAGNSFFAECKKGGAPLDVVVQAEVVCFFGSYDHYIGTGSMADVSEMQVLTIVDDEGGGNTRTVIGTICDNDLRYQTIHGVRTRMQVGSDDAIYVNVQRLAEAAGSYTPDGMFGVVGSRSATDSAYWTDNIVYECQSGQWYAKGAPRDYYQTRQVNSAVRVLATQLLTGMYVSLNLTGHMTVWAGSGVMIAKWSDPVRTTIECNGIRPAALLAKLMSVIAPGTPTIIEADGDGYLADTFLIPGEELRRISGAKIYTTFNDFAGWMEAVFGYTYKTDGGTLVFTHRSSVYGGEVVKTLENIRDVKYSVVDNLIYSTVEAGYSKKDYGEIDGRLETNFTNYYSTDYALTDKKLSLISKYRSDGYGIEFAARKSESESTDDKADEDVFFLMTSTEDGVPGYQPGGNAVFNPALCVANNAAFIAAMGNGASVTLVMTSSSGNNALEDVTIDDALFTAGELEVSTDDMEPPSDVNALVEVSHDGYLYRGYVKSAEARFGREAGMEYTLIVKTITKYED